MIIRGRASYVTNHYYSVICQKSFQAFNGFLGFLGFRKPGNLKTLKPNYIVYDSTVNRLLIGRIGEKFERVMVYKFNYEERRKLVQCIMMNF